MSLHHKKRKRGFGKLLAIVLLLSVGGLAFLATQDSPPPSQTITKTITPSNPQ